MSTTTGATTPAPRTGAMSRRSDLRRSWADRVVVLVASAPAAWLAWRFWRQQAIDPLTFPALLLDRGLQVLTVAAAGAVVLVILARTTIALSAAVLVAGVGAVLAASILLSGIVRPPVDLTVMILAAIAAAASIGLLVRFAPRIPLLSSVPSQIAAAIVAAAVPLLQLWNSVSFLPSQTEAAIGQELAVMPVGSDGGFTYSEVNLKVKNDTDTRVLIIISKMTVCFWGPGEEIEFGDSALLRREDDNCPWFRPLFEASWISPKSELTWSTVVRSPEDKHQITLVSRIAFARGDRLRTARLPKALTTIGSCEIHAAAVWEESRVRGVAQENKYLVYSDPDGQQDSEGLNYHFRSGVIDCTQEHEGRLDSYFGVTETRISNHRWVDPPATTTTTTASPRASPS